MQILHIPNNEYMNIDKYILVLTWLNAGLGIYAAFTNARGKKTAFIMWIFMDSFNIIIYSYYQIWAKLTTALVYLIIAIYGYIKKTNQNK